VPYPAEDPVASSPKTWKLCPRLWRTHKMGQLRTSTIKLPTTVRLSRRCVRVGWPDRTLNYHTRGDVAMSVPRAMPTNEFNSHDVRFLVERMFI
jgi:hypothetical protein